MLLLAILLVEHVSTDRLVETTHIESEKSMDDHNIERDQLVSALKNEGIKDDAVLKAILEVPRHVFIDKKLEKQAYDNTALPIGYAQTISQPFIVAFMTQQAQLNYNSKVLEIGTGSGYQAAILAEICKEVFTIEWIEQLSNNAAQLLKKLGYKNINFKVGDGKGGWGNAAPFDAIIVTAKAMKIPEALIQQLVVGGCMIIPLQKTSDKQVLVKITKKSDDNSYNIEELSDVRFVPLL